MTTTYNERQFTLDGLTHTVRFSRGMVLRVERRSEASVHGGGYVVGTSKGVVGNNYVATTHSDWTRIWLQLEGGKEEYIQVNCTIPAREGNAVELMRIDGHYVVKTVGYDTRDRPIIEKASNLLAGIRIVETGQSYACRDLQSAVAYEPFYTGAGRLFLWSFLWMPAMGAGLLIWAWLLLRAVLLRAGSSLYGVPEEVAKNRYLQTTGFFEEAYRDFSMGRSTVQRYGT